MRSLLLTSSLLCTTVFAAAPSTSAPCSKAAECAALCAPGGVKCLPLALQLLSANGAGRDPSAALVALERGCAQGEALACRHLSQQLGHGVVGAVDGLRSRLLLAKACELRESLSCALQSLQEGAQPAAQRTLQVACRNRDAFACDALAESQPASAPELLRALPWFERRCEQNDAIGCEHAAHGLWAKREGARARQKLEQACALDNARACSEWAEALSTGRGGPVDASKAAPAWDRACQRGVAEACDAFAEALRTGTGVKKDEAKASTLRERALKAYAQACERSDGASCFREGLLTRGSPQAQSHFRLAAPLLRQACERRDGAACALLAQDARDGLSGVVQLSNAMKLLRRACELGSTSSCEELASHYATGKWRDADTRRALALYRHSCEAGSSRACAEEQALSSRPPVVASATPGKCEGGQVADEDAPSRCCWPGQVWSSADGRCVGSPSCPPDKLAQGEACGCAEGRESTRDGHCCWQGQAWSASAHACAGSPTACPATHLLRAGSCEPLPACEGGRVATQQSEGQCCWPGQHFANGQCTGAASGCGPQWVLSGAGCVPGPELVWKYLVSAVGQAAYAMTPEESTLQHRASVVRVLSGAGCTLKLSEETTDDSPRFEGGHLRLVRETTVPLSEVSSINVSEMPASHSRAGSEYFLSVTAPNITQKTTTFRDTYDSAADGYLPLQESKDEGGVETWGRFVSFPGGAAEAAKGIAVAARACGAAPQVATGPGGDLQAEQLELANRLMLQATARAEGARALVEEGRTGSVRRGAGPSIGEAIVAGVQQGQSELVRFQETLRRSLDSRVAEATALAASNAIPAGGSAERAPSASAVTPVAANLPAASPAAEAASPAKELGRAARGSRGASQSAGSFAAPASALLPRKPAPLAASVPAVSKPGPLEAESTPPGPKKRPMVIAAPLMLGNVAPSEQGPANVLTASSNTRARVVAPVTFVGPGPARCSARQGESCWFSPEANACPSYPSLDACAKHHGRCVVRTGPSSPSC